ncbi:copper resistance protein CopC/CopD [Planosporangium thailandense]|uniref:Copper resistance protein CopC/CopD n=1 Tax=Planosporangium thailandense TaxID=765197 RepID=A0ABX0Y5X7_9ACTN|nr:copper resistance protein CopC [Planosporangium thailandense]NJC73802.1 copper resistance protein CopC/CopD [Planosporangium thailandense]
MRRLLYGWLVAVIAGALLPLTMAPTAASAHAYLARSTPGDGAMLDRAPESLTLSFTEHVELSATRVDIVDGDGRHYTPTSITLAKAATDGAAVASGTETPADVVVGLPKLPANVYHILWSTLSSDDLHTTSGNLVIGVQRSVPAAARAPRPAGPAPLETTLRDLGLLGLSVLFGGAALALLLARRLPDVRRRLLDVAASGGALALVSTPVQLVAQVYAGTGGAGSLLLREAFSGRWLAREVGLLALTAVVLRARAALRSAEPEAAGSTGMLVVGGAGALAAAVGTAMLGHRTTGVMLAATAVHVLAAGAWAGSVVAAALALVPVLRSGDSRSAQVAALLRAFAALAVGAVVSLTITGLLLTGTQVATVDALLTTPYGWMLIAKTVALAVAGLLGLRTARRLRGDGGAVPVRGLLTEATALVVALGLAGGLASAGPARGPRFESTAAVKIAPQVSGQSADLVDTVEVRPNLPGRNVIRITVADTRRPALAPISGVSVFLRSPDGVQTVHPVTRAADGSWTVTTDDIRSPGGWKVTVTVLRNGLAPVTDVHDWGVAGAGTGSKAVVSSAPVKPAATVLAGVAAVAGLIVLAVWYARRRRPAESTGDDGPGGPDGPEGPDEPDGSDGVGMLAESKDAPALVP